MDSFNIELRERIEASLHELISRSEDIYLRLGDSFPRLLKELDVSLRRGRALVEELRSDRANFSRSGGNLEDAIHEVRSVISEGRESFGLMRRHDTKNFDELSNALSQLGGLGDRIASIKEDSVEMELISINAMTVAVKAGHAGEAFSYITEELKRLAGRTIRLSEDITSRGDHLLEVFGTYRGEMEEAAGTQEEVFSTASDRLDESFTSLQDGVRTIVEKLNAITEESAEIRQPLQRIMQEVQLQDIIRQSLEHVIISVRELEEIADTEGDEAALDELTFFVQLPDLCTRILDDVKDRIRNSVEVFRTESKHATEIASAMEHRRSEFITRYIEDSGQEPASLHSLYERSAELLDTLVHDLNGALRKKRRVADRSRELMREVNRLSEDFRTFSVLVNRFHSVDIHSRIEVAKQPILQRMSGTVEEMTALTGRIEHDVEESVSETSQFMKLISSVLEEFERVLTEESTFVIRFSERVRTRFERFYEARGTLAQGIHDHSVFTHDFLELFGRAKGDHASLEELTRRLDQVKDQLFEIKQAAEHRRKSILQQRNLEGWSIESERLRSIIERFTIFTHKESAGRLGGFDVEHGAEAGEVTLF